jgi:predicted PurR-regulated permease PerM
MIPTLIKPQNSDDVASLVSAVALAIFAMIVVSVLYLGREIFVPVALAILLSFVLALPVRLLQRVGVSRGIAVVAVVLLAFAMIFALGSLIATQLNRLAGRAITAVTVFHSLSYVFRILGAHASRQQVTQPRP